jgi:hypothetical protein
LGCQLDVKTAFLNGELKEEIYMQQAQRFEEGGPGMVCHLKKMMYDLRQAPEVWHMRLKAELKALGFRASETNPALFVKGAGRHATYVLRYDVRASAFGTRAQTRYQYAGRLSWYGLIVWANGQARVLVLIG